MTTKIRIVPIEVMVGPKEHVCADGTTRLHGSNWENLWRVEVDVKHKGQAQILKTMIQDFIDGAMADQPEDSD